MAVDMDSDHDSEIKDLKHLLRTAGLELSLERSKHSVEIVAKDEDIRKLRVRQCLLQDESSDLHEQLEEEQGRADVLESALDEALVQLDEQNAAAAMAQNQIRTHSRETANLKAELKAMENVTSDSNKILSEKLALNRELSSLRPEVEHLRAQVESNAGLLAEKLALQRQLNTAQVELENERRTAARARAKQGKKMEQDDELRVEIEELRNEIAKEQEGRAKVEATLAKTEDAIEKAHADLRVQQQATERVQTKLDKVSRKEVDKASKRGEERDDELEQLRDELASEKSARVKAEKANKKGDERDAELEEVREELANEKRQRQKLEKASKKGSQQNEVQSDDLRKELDGEKRERKKLEKEYTKTLAELQGRNSVLDDKLNAFREKLRTTKDKLKEREAALERAERAQTAPPVKVFREGSVKPATNIRKRLAASVEPETNLGTPGNGFPAKKAKRGISVSAVGDTSTFSLTPLLNRTGSVAPGETIIEEEEGEEDGASAAAQETTPTAPPKKAFKKAAVEPKKPLAPSASNKANAKPRKKATVPTLEMVTEEVSHLSHSKDNSENAPITIQLKTSDGPSSKSLVPKPRKSLMSFATFTEEAAAEKKKKRKLGASSTGGGLGKTLFDADEEDDAPAKPTSSKGIFAARALGKSVLGKGKGQGPISGGYNMLSEEGFSFSPLKKDRRGASILK